MAFADIYNMEQRLNQIDPRIIRIDFDSKRMRHKVVAWDEKNHEEYIAFTVPFGQLDARVEWDVYKSRPESSYDPFEEIRQSDIKKEREEDKKISDMAYSMADMLYKPLMRDATGA